VVAARDFDRVPEDCAPDAPADGRGIDVVGDDDALGRFAETNDLRARLRDEQGAALNREQIAFRLRFSSQPSTISGA
jgi:hypothetical protein